MTISISDFITLVQQQYNAVGDALFGQDLMLNLIWAGQMELAVKAKVIENIYTTTTVASQQEYSYPTNATAIKRIEYYGQKLTKIDDRQFDALTLNNSTAVITGTPTYYKEFDRTLFLLPTPDAARTLKIFAYSAPTQPTISSSFEVPDDFVLDLADYCLYRMSAMNKNFEVANFYKNSWEMKVQKAVEWQRAKKRSESFTRVLDEDEIPLTIIGTN